jgi:chromosome segregation ATPase
MTRFSKILLVLVLFTSIAFMGFTAVSSVGGPNWVKEKDAMTDYLFDFQPGENPIWSVKTRRGGEQISSSPVLAKAIVAAQKHKIQQQNEKIEQVTKTIPPLEKAIKNWQQVNQVDREAMSLTAVDLKEKISALNSEITQLANEGIKISQQTLEINQQAAERRADVFRLQDQIEEIRNEKYLTQEQQKTLRDYIARLEGKVQRLQRQKEALEKTVGSSYEEKNVTQK